jgi:uncharacterized protein with PIN domain
VQAAKEEVATELELLTRRHYDRFWRLTRGCKIYWEGSHWRSLRKLFDEL